MKKLYKETFKKITDIKNPVYYSEYKYGNLWAMRYLAKQMAYYLIENISEITSTNKEIVLIGGSCDNVDNPMMTLSKEIVIELSLLVKQRVHLTKVHRIIRHNEPYCQMILEDRLNLIKDDVMHFEHSILNNRISIIIDDVFITGTHEKKVLNIVTPDYYVYLLKYEGENAAIEEEINLHSISGVWDIFNWWQKNDLVFQSRNIKYVLYNLDKLDTNIKSVKRFVQEVKRLAILNNYNHINNLKPYLQSLTEIN